MLHVHSTLRATLGVFASLLLAQDPLTDDAVFKMVKAGLSDEIVVTAINQQPGRYSVSPDDLVALKNAGVSEKVLAAMLSKNHGAATSTNAPPTPAIPQPPIILHDETPVRLRLNRNVSSADATVGESVDFEVLDDLKIDDVLVIARGGTAIATVTQAQAKRRMARGGKLDINIDFVRLVNGEKAALRAVKQTSGGGHTGAMTGAIVATSLVFLPAAPFFLFMHGKDVTIPKGTEITAYVNGEIKLDRDKFKAGVMQQPSTAQPMAPSDGAPAPLLVSPPSSNALVDVTFTSNPAGAAVSFAGAPFSRTPFVTKLQPGQYAVKMELAGYANWTGTVVVEAGKPSTVAADMAR
jgi:hypothetical protein